MDAYFFQFAKKRNSTARPETSSGVNYTIQFKDETGVINPRITTIRPDARSFNYCYIPTLARYYFITDWQYLNGVWEASLSVDVLASYKTQIGSTTCTIERSASNYDLSLIDTYYPGKTNFSNRFVNLRCTWSRIAPSGGTYVIGIINGGTSGRFGATTYYALTPVIFKNLIEALLSDTFIESFGIEDITTALVKSLFNPLQYLTSCMWFPFELESFSNGTAQDIWLGYWDTGIEGLAVTNVSQKGYVTATIPQHPQASRGTYLNYAPYSRLTLYIPPFGAIPVDMSYLAAGRHLEAPVYIDHITGKAEIIVNFNDGSVEREIKSVAGSRTAQLAIPISLGQIIQDVLGAAGSAVGVVTSAITGNIGGVLSGVASAIGSLLPQESHAGANGSFIQQITEYVAVLQCTQISDENITDFGRPCGKRLTINTLSGFVKCADARPAISALLPELQDIQNYMAEGFYYE